MITTKQRAYLRSMANSLKPSVIIGKEELTPNIITEIDTALYHHELVKVAALKSCTASAKSMIQQVCQQLNCQAVQCVGNRFVVYRLSDKEGIEHIVLPK